MADYCSECGKELPIGKPQGDTCSGDCFYEAMKKLGYDYRNAPTYDLSTHPKEEPTVYPESKHKKPESKHKKKD